MIPVILILISWWACAGAVASVKAARASGPEQTSGGTAARGAGSRTTAASKTSDPQTSAPETDPAPGSGDITFGQWQRAAYTRWRRRIRSAIPGQHLGKRASDLIGDISAATIAGTALFGLGFASGLTWAGSRFAQQSATRRARPDSDPAEDFNSRPQPGRRWRWTRSPSTTRPPGRRSGPRFGSPRGSTRSGKPNARTEGGVVDVELIGTPAAPQNTGRFAGAEDADVVPDNRPPIGITPPTSHRPDHPATPNGRTMEILTIHHLFAWARAVVAHTVNAVDHALVRSRSATERAAVALARSSAAVARAESAAIAAAAARGYAVQLEETGARFQVLRMDSASMTSIGVAITASISLGQLAHRRAEAEAVVAAKAAELAVAEEVAALAAAAEAAGAQACAEAVQHMHDTVHRHQMPHAIAQAATGNAAAHSSVLAGG